MSIISKNIENLKPNKEYIVTVRAKNNDINVLSGYTDSVRFRTPTDSTIPNAPSNLALAASFLNVLFKYTDSVDEDTAKYEYELYKQAQIEVVGGLNSIISGQTPHRTGFVQTNVFLVSVDDNSTTTSTSGPPTNPVKYYGRVRSIDSAGNIGSWTNIVGSGDTPLIDEAFIGSLTAGKITAGTIGAHEIILTQPGPVTEMATPNNKAILRSSDYNGAYNNLTNTWSAGSTGWIISGDGRAEFNNATIRGTLQFIDGSAPGSIYYGATQPSIPSPFTAKLISAIYGDGTSVTYTTAVAHGLSVGKIVSLNHVIPSQYNLKNQYVTAVRTSAPHTFTVTSSATGTFDPIYSIGAEVVAGQIPEYSIWYNSTSGDNKSYIYSSSTWNQSLGNVSNLNPQNQTQTGLIAGTTINGGGIILTNGGNIRGGQTDYNAGIGFFLGYSGTKHKFSIGNSVGNKLTWDGENLTVTGAINATSGTFNNTITVGTGTNKIKIVGTSLDSGTYINTGSTTATTGNGFYFGADGKVRIASATNSLTFDGAALTVTGSITGSTISGSTITGSTLTTASSGNRVHVNTNDITLYYNGDDVSNINFSGNSNYSSSIISSGTIRIRGLGDDGQVRIGTRPSLVPGTYIYGLEGVEIKGGSDSDLSYKAHLTIGGSSGNEANLTLQCYNTEIQLRSANNNSTLYLRRADDTADANLSLGTMSVSGNGISYFGNSTWGGTSNQIGITWISSFGSIMGHVDNANSIVLGTTSDRRLKGNIQDCNTGLSLLDNFRVVSYNPLKVSAFIDSQPIIEGTHDEITMIGLIADEVETCAPWLVSGDSKIGQLQSVNYALITPILINAIKEISQRLEILENQ
jgi:hypothetical protein